MANEGDTDCAMVAEVVEVDEIAGRCWVGTQGIVGVDLPTTRVHLRTEEVIDGPAVVEEGGQQI
jgi:hypothetical protein